jgi:hypothetical protein
MGIPCNTRGGGEACVKHFIGKPEGKGPLEISKHRCEDSIKGKK